ncbi:MAG: hypothetical protein QM501_06280, partial [Gimesia sp.]
NGTTIESFAALEPSLVTISNSLTELNENRIPSVNLTLNLNSSALDRNELDLTVLEGFSDELISDLRLNGLAIVDAGETNGLDDSSLNDTDLNLPGISEQLDVGFDDVFSDWTGPIL